MSLLFLTMLLIFNINSFEVVFIFFLKNYLYINHYFTIKKNVLEFDKKNLNKKNLPLYC